MQTTEFTTDQKGAIAETAIIHEAVKLGVGVFKPLTDGERYDLIFDLRPQLVRVQCKWAVRRGDVVVVRCVSCRRTRHGLSSRRYTVDEVDAFAAYCEETDVCYYLPLSTFSHRRGVHLRLAPSRNGQMVGINWASHHTFGATLTALLGP